MYLNENFTANEASIMADDYRMLEIHFPLVQTIFDTHAHDFIEEMFADFDMDEFNAYKTFYVTLKGVPGYFQKYSQMFFKYLLYMELNAE